MLIASHLKVVRCDARAVSQHHPIAAHVQVDEIVHMPRLANARRAHHVEWIATLPELRPMRITISFNLGGWDLHRLLSGNIAFCLFGTVATIIVPHPVIRYRS